MNSTREVPNEFYPLSGQVARAFPLILNEFYYNSFEN